MSEEQQPNLDSSPLGAHYIPTLNGWRAIAVLLVIGAHSYTMLQNSGSKVGAEAATLFAHAGVGVDIFFAISGFLICTLLLNEKDRYGKIDLYGFYLRRAFRILPPLFVYLTVIAILRINGTTPKVTFVEIASSALFFRNYVQDTSWYVGHFWSLAIEEHFYLFVPLVLATSSWKQALKFAVIMVVACALIRWAEYLYYPNMKIEFRTEARIDAIMYGAISALLVQKFRPTLESYLTGSVTLAIVVVIVLSCYAFPAMPVRRTLMAMVIPIPIVFTAIAPQSLLSFFLELSPLRCIGKLSYSLYIWQMLFLVPGDREMPIVQNFPYAFVAAITCATISYYLVERPSIRAGHQIKTSALSAFR